MGNGVRLAREKRENVDGFSPLSVCNKNRLRRARVETEIRPMGPTKPCSGRTGAEENGVGMRGVGAHGSGKRVVVWRVK